MRAKRARTWLVSAVILWSFLSFSALAQDDKPAQTKHEPIAQQLITMVEHNSELKKMLVDSIELARRINPDKVTNPAQTLD